MEEIRTERLILRPFRESDLDDLYEFLSQLENDEFEGYPGITYENCRKHLEYGVGSEEFYAVERKDTGRVIGNIYCGVRDYDAREIGYIINRNHQGKGFACEALKAVIAHAFRTGVHRVYAECDPRNTPSWKLLEKAGLRREARFRQNIYFRKDENGLPVWKDTYIYAVTENNAAGGKLIWPSRIFMNYRQRSPVHERPAVPGCFSAPPDAVFHAAAGPVLRSCGRCRIPVRPFTGQSVSAVDVAGCSTVFLQLLAVLVHERLP